MHELEFTTYELIMLVDALEILQPDNDDAENTRTHLIAEIEEEIYQNGENT
jgi:hypothetical protein